MSGVYARGVARIRHRTRSDIFEIDANELDWNQVAADERQMGVEVEHEAVIEHAELGMLVWRLWEYPLGMENDREVDLNGHEAIDHIDFGLSDADVDADIEPEDDRLSERLSALPAQLDQLEVAIAKLRDLAPMLGHNQPPEEARIGVSDVDLAQIPPAIDAIRTELASPDPSMDADIVVVDGARRPFELLRDKIMGWLKWAGPKLGGGLVTAIGGYAGKELLEHHATILHQLGAVIDTLAMWVQHLTLLI